MERLLFQEVEKSSSRQLLIHGPPKSGRTSLLFQLLLHVARQGKRTLLYSCNRLDRLPLLESQPAVHLLKQIAIRYPENSDDLIRSLSYIHTEDKELLPYLIAIDDVDSFVIHKHGHEQVALLAKILSYAVDAAEFASKATAVDGQDRDIQCNLIVTTVSASPVYGHWFPFTACIQEVTTVGSKEFELIWSRSFTDSSRQDDIARQLGSYSFSPSGLLWHQAFDQTVP